MNDTKEKFELITGLKDPTVGAYVYSHKHFPVGENTDSRFDFISMLNRTVTQLGLDKTNEAIYQTPDDINLFAVDRSEEDTEDLINRYHDDGYSLSHTYAFTYLDTLVAQIYSAKIDEEYPLTSTKKDANHFVKNIIGTELLSGQDEGNFGGTFFIWAIIPKESDFNQSCLKTISAFDGEPNQMVKIEHGIWAEIQIEQNPGLLILTYETAEAEQWANEILLSHLPTLPPLLLRLELARCKFAWQYQRYRDTKLQLGRLGRELDRRLDWLIDTQRYYQNQLRVVGSRESIEFTEKLARAITDYADYRRAVTHIHELKNTLKINNDNYSTHLPISLKSNPDSFFEQRLKEMGRIEAQIEADAAYINPSLERAEIILETASARAEIIRGEQDKEQTTFQSIQTSAITAIAVGVAMLQVVPTIAQLVNHLFIGMLIVFLMIATFALSQIVFNWKRVKTPIDRLSVAVTLSLLLTLFPAWKWGGVSISQSLLWMLISFLAGFILAFVGFIWIEEKYRRRSEKEGKDFFQPVEGDPVNTLLNHAVEELHPLLEDLPPTKIFRVKTSDSLREKLVRKEYKKLTEVGDEIGIRYVVAPWEIPRTVRQIQSRIRVKETEYKTGDYKAVHIMADLLGAGDDRDLDLTAEIQVKTRLQNTHANFADDHIYKPKHGKPGIPAKFINWLLAMSTDVEMLIFQQAMGWQKPKPISEDLPYVKEINAVPSVPVLIENSSVIMENEKNKQDNSVKTGKGKTISKSKGE